MKNDKDGLNEIRNSVHLHNTHMFYEEKKILESHILYEIKQNEKTIYHLSSSLTL